MDIRRTHGVKCAIPQLSCVFEHFYNESLGTLRSEADYGSYHPYPEGKRPYVLFPGPELAAALQVRRPWGRDQGSRTQSSPSAGTEGPGSGRAHGMAGLGQLPNKRGPQITETPRQTIGRCASPRTPLYMGFSLESVVALMTGSFTGDFLSARPRRKHLHLSCHLMSK